MKHIVMTIAVALAAALLVQLHAQVLLNEVASTNPQLVADESSEYPDWIELYNSGLTTVNIAGWSLTDNPLNPDKWLLPDIDLAPAERLLVFASGNDLNSFTPDTGPATNHWETVMNDNSAWQYFVGTSQPAASWNTDITNASGWSSATGGFGYGDSDDGTNVPAGTVSVYYRKTFTVANEADWAEALLSIDYDDAFIAYLNGTEIARYGLSGVAFYDTPSELDHEAQMYQGGDPDQYLLDYTTIQSLLVPGTNVLAIEVHNVGSSSSDLTGRTWLHAGIASATTYYGSNPSWFIAPAGGVTTGLHTNFKISYGETVQLYDATGLLMDEVIMNVQSGHARARIPDAGSWCYTNVPTPDSPNTGTCYSGYANTPTVNPPSGFYTSTVSVIMSGTSVRYTVNGDVPTTGSPLYTGPVSIPATDVVRVRAFQAGKLPSETVERTYFINDPTTLPVVSVIAHSGDLFNDGTGGPGVYDNASGFTQSLTTGCSIQYFDAAHNMQFETDASLTPVGNWSLGFPQKSLQFKYDEEYGATGDIPYNIFSLDKSWLGPSHGFRVRNTDDDWGSWYGTGARMRDLVSNRMAISTHSGTAAYQNCAVFINGEYWGHYAAREMLNTYFMRDNYGADDAHVHMVKNSYPSQEYQAEVGTNTSFFEMSDFVINTDMSVESNFQQATDLVDIENWVDYWANEIYNNNQDWFPSIYFNNTRLAHAPEDGVKWKYILWDVGFSQGNSGSPWDDLLYQALEAPTVANRHTDMMKSLLENAEFKRYFINRFADLLNWNWTTTKMHALIDACAVEIAPEIPRQDAAWGSGDFEYWQGQVDNLKDFHTERPAYQREHIENYFELNGQVNITLNVTPANAGYVKISTVTPTTYPWTGIYFNGNPVTVTAVPKPGYTFVNWSANAFISNLSQASFTANVTANTTFTAHFTGAPVVPDIVVTELNYNSDTTRAMGDWIELYNNSAVALNLTDWQLKDANYFNAYVFPAGTVMGPGQYLVVCDDVQKFALEHPGVANVIGNIPFDFANGGETLSLYNNQGTLMWSFLYDDAGAWPCTPDGHGRTLERNLPFADPNLAASWYDGCIGGSPGGPASLCDEEPVVSEINYKSPLATDAGDWIELHNSSGATINLSGWILQDQEGNAYQIPGSTQLADGAYLVLFENDTLFAQQHPGITNAIGPFAFAFNGDGDVVRLIGSDGKIQMSVCYNDVAPWPAEADGGGYTLEFVGGASNVNDGANWFAGCVGGSPGVAFDPDCTPCIAEGCMDPVACNYDASADCENGSCVYATTWYLDGDNDTWYSAQQSVCASPGMSWYNVPPSGGSGDCDDSNASVHPGAPGTAQGIDNDCSGIVEPDEAAPCPGDMNFDGVVNISDMLLFVADYGCSGTCIGDLDGNGTVNTADLLMFMGWFGTICQ